MTEEQSLSQELRSAREQRGLAIEEVIRQTGLSANVVHGLEEDRFDVVEPVFTRMALRTYAEFLQLDVGSMLERFERQAGVPGATTAASAPPLTLPAAAYDSPNRRVLRTLLIMIVGLVAVLAAVIGVIHYTAPERVQQQHAVWPPPPGTARDTRQPPAESRAPADREHDMAQTPAQPRDPLAPQLAARLDPAAPVFDLADSLSAPVTDPFDRDAAVPAADGTEAAAAVTRAEPGATRDTSDTDAAAATDTLLRLAIQGIETTWIRIESDGAVRHQGLVQPGERHAWEGREYILLHSGLAGGLRYWFQDEPLDSDMLGDPAQVLRFRSTHQGITLLNADLQPLGPPLPGTGTQP